VEWDPTTAGLRLALSAGGDDGVTRVVTLWGGRGAYVGRAGEYAPDSTSEGSAWLHLSTSMTIVISQRLVDGAALILTDTRLLRSDYEDERYRVNQLMECLMDIARVSSYPLPPAQRVGVEYGPAGEPV
jgi:hypothetical protein